MNPVSLVETLDVIADEARDLEVPEDPATCDALVVCAMRVGYEVLGLAQRIMAAQRELDSRRPYPRPKPKPRPPRGAVCDCAQCIATRRT